MHNPYTIIDATCTADVAPIAHHVRRFIEATIEFTEGWVGLSVMPYGELPRTAWASVNDRELLTTMSIRAARRNVVDRWGVHLNMAPRQDRPAAGRGGDAAVLCLPCLWVDIDDAGERTLNTLRSFGPLPSIIARSGGGYHAYWCLVTPAPHSLATSRINLSLANTLGGDVAASRPSSMMRVPGTINTKPGRGNIVEIVDWDYGRLYRIDDFAWLDPGPIVQRPRAVRVKTDQPDKATITAEQVAALCRNAKPYHGGWKASCPCPGHGKGKGDTTPSLTIRQGESAVLIKCFGGCTIKDIVNALGLTMSELFSADSRPASRAEMRTLWQEMRTGR